MVWVVGATTLSNFIMQLQVILVFTTELINNTPMILLASVFFASLKWGKQGSRKSFHISAATDDNAEDIELKYA